MLSDEMKQHLEKAIVPFWQNLRDEEFGGYYGLVDFDGKTDKMAVKGGILHLRILWFFSSVYELLGREDIKRDMEHAYSFVFNNVLDPVHGGAFWSLKADGTIEDSTKHTYCQAFALYSVTAYYQATGKSEALDMAMSLFHLIENNCKDEYGYLEAFDREFQPVSNEKLSGNGVVAEKTMNTLLHVMEGYTELYRGTHDPEIKEALLKILEGIVNKVYNPILGRQEVFFDKKMNSIVDVHSYGHDIEAAWLLDRTCEVLGDSEVTAIISPITKELTKTIYNKAFINGSVINESENGVDNLNRIWWVQAESVVGFLNGYEKDEEHVEYFEAALTVWTYIQSTMVDSRDNSEWFWQVDENGNPDKDKPMVEPWKCPYHNGRMCIEVIRRNINGTY